MENHEVNLHTHTVLCKHASGNVSDYCRSAVTSGLKVLGISEHSPFPDDRLLRTRPSYSQREDLRKDMEDAVKAFPSLTVLKGMEMDVDETLPEEYYKRELKEYFDLDYMCTGVHFVQKPDGSYIHIGVNLHYDMETVRLYTEKTVSLMKSGIYDFITHPDMFCASVEDYTPELEKCLRQIIETALETGVYMELNAYGFRKPEVTYDNGISRHPYPLKKFWVLAAEYDAPFVCFSDAHKPEDVQGNIPEMIRFGEELGLSCVNTLLVEKILKRKAAKEGK